MNPQKTKEKQLKSVNYKQRSCSRWKIIPNECDISLCYFWVWNISFWQLYLFEIITLPSSPFVRRFTLINCCSRWFLKQNNSRRYNAGCLPYCAGWCAFTPCWKFSFAKTHTNTKTVSYKFTVCNSSDRKGCCESVNVWNDRQIKGIRRNWPTSAQTVT